MDSHRTRVPNGRITRCQALKQACAGTVEPQHVGVARARGKQRVREVAGGQLAWRGLRGHRKDQERNGKGAGQRIVQGH